jgi:hypothetical protein
MCIRDRFCSCFVADYMTKILPFLILKNYFKFIFKLFSSTKKPGDKIPGLSNASKPIKTL